MNFIKPSWRITSVFQLNTNDPLPNSMSSRQYFAISDMGDQENVHICLPPNRYSGVLFALHAAVVQSDHHSKAKQDDERETFKKPVQLLYLIHPGPSVILTVSLTNSTNQT